MKNNHDPYLTTVKRSLNEQRIKTRKDQVKKKQNNYQKTGFFSRKFELRNFIDLPEGLQEVVLFGFFILIPYIVGVVSILLTQLDMSSFQSAGLHEFLFAWTIGYELCATFMLLTLIQQSFTYKDISR